MGGSDASISSNILKTDSAIYLVLEHCFCNRRHHHQELRDKGLQTMEPLSPCQTASHILCRSSIHSLGVIHRFSPCISFLHLDRRIGAAHARRRSRTPQGPAAGAHAPRRAHMRPPRPRQADRLRLGATRFNRFNLLNLTQRRPSHKPVMSLETC